jgi:hypothetical protein
LEIVLAKIFGEKFGEFLSGKIFVTLSFKENGIFSQEIGKNRQK